MSSSQNAYLRAAVIVCGVLVEECGEQYAAVVAKELLSRPLGSDGGSGDGSGRLSGSVVDAQTERVEGWLCECEEAKRGGVCSCFYVRAVRAESRGSDIKTRLGIMGQICADGVRQVHSCNVSRALCGDDECRVDANMSTVAGKSDTKPCLVEKVTGDIRDGVNVSARTLANRDKRARKKNRKLRKQAEAKLSEVDWRKTAKPNTVGYKGAFELCDEETRRKLAETRARRLISENEACVRKAQVESDRWNSTVKLQRKQEDLQMLKVGKQIEALRSSGVEAIQEDLEQRRLSQQLKIAQSRQKLELIAAQDLEGLKRRQASKVLRDTETNKVAVERAFGTLAGTGNIPSLVGGKVYTVNSGSISPNSSASEAEVRAIQKENLDLRKQVEELSAKLQKPDVPDYGEYDYSEGVTIDEDGHPIGDFGDYSGYIGRDNRFHFGESMMPYFD